MKRLLIAAVTIMFVVGAFTVSAETFGRANIRDVYVIHFILDGTNFNAFNKAMDEGLLPVLKDHFVDNGASFAHALSVFPSTSSTVYQSYTTGLLPGHSGIPHLERFDREHEKVVGYLTASGYKMLNSDLINLRALTNPDVVEIEPPTTIFELLKGHPTASVYSSFARGASEIYPGIPPVAALWSGFVADRQESLDILAMKRVVKLFSRTPNKIPRYTLVGLYSSDIMGHKYGPDSPEVLDILHQFDLFLRDFFDLLKKQGIADKTYIIVSADHGMHETGKLLHFQDALEDAGVAVKPRDTRRHDYNIYAANRGVVSSHVYVRHNKSFAPLTDPEILRNIPLKNGGTIDLIKFILQLDSTDLLIVRSGERSARIFDRDGSYADVACYTVSLTDFCSYLDTNGDPLGYKPNKLADGKPHSIYAWRDATAGMSYPDAVVGLSQIFHDGRAGDIFITTRGHYGFRKVKAGNHGGAGEDDMRVPLLISGPAISHGTLYTARPVDLYPLVLEWFGIPTQDANHDGVNPFVQFAGDDPKLQQLALLEQMFDNADTHVNHGKFANLGQLASEETELRATLVQKLEALLGELNAEKASKSAPKIADYHYLDDHIAIAQRTLDWAKKGLERMEKIKSTLPGKKQND